MTRVKRLVALVVPVLLVVAAIPASVPVATAASETARARPAVVEVRTIGHSVKGRAILAWRLGTPTSKRKVVVLGDKPRARTAAKRTPSRATATAANGLNRVY